MRRKKNRNILKIRKGNRVNKKKNHFDNVKYKIKYDDTNEGINNITVEKNIKKKKNKLIEILFKNLDIISVLVTLFSLIISITASLISSTSTNEMSFEIIMEKYGSLIIFTFASFFILMMLVQKLYKEIKNRNETKIFISNIIDAYVTALNKKIFEKDQRV